MSKVVKVTDLLHGGLSETGLVRENNQDAILLPDRSADGVFVSTAGIADGMGGYAAGDIASRLALTTVRQTIVDAQGSLDPEKILRRGTDAANLRVYKAARELGEGRMGTTLTMAYFAGETLHLAHVGDSRAYLIRDRRITCLSTDHTLVGDLVRTRIITPDKVRTHAQRSVLTRSIGLDLFVTPDITRHKLIQGDLIILCSDGVWAVLEDDEMAALAAPSKSPTEISTDLVQHALDKGSDDNCSVVAIRIRGFISITIPEPASTNRRSWLSSLF